MILFSLMTIRFLIMKVVVGTATTPEPTFIEDEI